MSSTEPHGTRRTVLVTGAAGRFGRLLTRLLHRSHRVVALDPRPFPDCPRDVEHAAGDLLRRRTRDLVRRVRFDAVIHLGVGHDPRDVGEEAHFRNVVGFQRLLDYVQEAKIPQLLLLSSAVVYGPRPDNPQLIPEHAPLLAAGASSALRDLVTVDMVAQSFLYKQADTATAVLRPCHIVGTVSNAAADYLRLGVVPTLLGFDPMVQVLHQRDLARAILLALDLRARGIFNVAGPEPVPLSKALALLGRRRVPVPLPLARLALGRLFQLRFSSFPAEDLDFIRYVCMCDDSKARRELGYRHVFDLRASLSSVDDERWVSSDTELPATERSGSAGGGRSARPGRQP